MLAIGLTIAMYAEEQGVETGDRSTYSDEQEAEAVIRKIYAAFSAGDTQATIDMIGDGFRMFEPGPDDILPWAGRFTGKDGFMEFNERLADSLANVSISELRFEAIGDGRVLVTGVETGTSAATGRSYESSSLWIWRVQDGAIVSMRAYHDTEAMAAAFRD